LLLPHRSMPKRGPKCTRGSYRVLPLRLWGLYTGMQGKCLPGPPESDGPPALHYTPVYQDFARWADEGSLWQALVASVRHLAVEKPLERTGLHGDGPHTVAQKGARGWATRATNISRAPRALPSSTSLATSSRLSLWLRSRRPTWACCRRA
jgi:hypothetical protein